MSRGRGWWWVVAVGALLIVAQGYGLGVYGVVLPELLAHASLGLDSGRSGTIGGLVYAGMLIGALVGGRLCDSVGRRRVVLAAAGWSTGWTLACAVVVTDWQLGGCRLMSGLGMGALVPALLALATEHGPRRKAGLIVTVLMAGIPIGAALAALVGLGVLPELGWRPMFEIGAALAMASLVGAAYVLPRSSGPAIQHARPRVLDVFIRFGGRTALFTVAAFANLMIIYGLNTWLPTVLGMLGYSPATALRGSLLLGASAVVGSIGLAAAADRWSAWPIALLCTVLSAVGLADAIRTVNPMELFGDVAVLGVSTQSALNLILAAVAESYPTSLRGTALGWSNGVGRLGAVLAPSLGGWLLAAGLGPRAVLLALLCSAVLATVSTGGLVLGGASSWAAARPAGNDDEGASAAMLEEVIAG